MPQLLPFFIIFLAGLLFSEMFKRLHLPLVLSLILAGVVIGPEALDLIKITPAIELIGRLGLVFLMFIAGLEVKLSGFAQCKNRVILLALINSVIPFLTGYAIVWYFGYSTIASLLVAIAFMSSSVAVIIPILEAKNFIHTATGRVIVGAIIVQDILSLAFLTLVLQYLNPVTTIPFPLFYVILIVTLVGLRLLIPYARRFFVSEDLTKSEKQLFQEELRLIIVALLGTVVIFEFLGLQDIVAGFFAGLVLSDSIKSRMIFEKIYAVGYGFFIPIFLILIGSKTNFSFLLQTQNAIWFSIMIVFGSMLSKVISGAIGASILGLSKKESEIIAFSTLPQIFMPLAIAFFGAELGLIDDKILTALVFLSVVTTFLGPVVISRTINNRSKSKKLGII